MGEVMREEAAKRPDDVVYVDTYKLFASSDGGWSRTIQDEKGDTITARISDGVHFTESGARYLARAVFSLLDARWHLTQQADLLHPIGWNFAPGSVDAVPGYRSKPTSRYHSGSSSGSDTSAVPVAETTTFPETPTSAIVVATTVVAPTVPPTVAPTTTPVATAPPTSASPTTGP
jgi:hypothetical protein